jgi:hypothetical protein
MSLKGRSCWVVNIRMDDAEKSVYHINAVDAVTQREVVGSTSRISEAYLELVLQHMLRQFPFRILGFRTDNGSEFIIRTVARLLEKLLIEQNKSWLRQSGTPPRRSLVATKNGAVLCKHIGYGYIDAKHADAINDFYGEYLNPYLNYHRRCAQADARIDEKGRKRIRYKRYHPLEMLSLLDRPAQYLCDGLSMNALKRVAGAIGDIDAAPRMKQAKSKLFDQLRLSVEDRWLRKRSAGITHIQNTKGQEPASPTLRFLQAHLSIGKDYRRKKTR